MALYIESINTVIDVHSLRLAAVNLRLPQSVDRLLYLSSIPGFLLVGAASSSDRSRGTSAMPVFALAFVAVLIIDLDRPQEGLLNVSQTAINDLLRQITPPGQ